VSNAFPDGFGIETNRFYVPSHLDTPDELEIRCEGKGLGLVS
jgi:hypothetical protein